MWDNFQVRQFEFQFHDFVRVGKRWIDPHIYGSKKRRPLLEA